MNTAQELRDIEDAILEAGAAQRTIQDAHPPAEAPQHAPALEPVAIVGLSGCFPGCQSVDQFWQALDRDASLVEEIPPSRFDWRTAGSRSRWGGFIPDIAGFEPAFFGIPPGEAVTMDPRQRLLLMSAYQTLGDAGYAPRSLKRSRTGVFVAIQDNEYLKLLEAAGIDTGEWYAQTSLLANRLSYFFDFRGASEVVDAQCPGAAVAIHRAVNALHLGELDQALVGAANLLLTPEPFALLSESGQLSPTSSVNSFGSGAQGHLRSEGVASVLLKPLSRALADNDHVYALIRSTAVNYNGQGGASIAAPNLESHVEVIKDCYGRARIDPRRVRYIEAQGMGNVLADLVEWQAFNRALGELAHQERLVLEPGTCRVSTVKPMMGHMESASALGALFKVVRSLESGLIHKVANFTDYHPDMERAGEPCAIAEQTAPWPRTDGPRLAGVHCYGMGGINAHLLIEEFEPAPRGREQPRPALIVLSARSEASLATMVRELHQHVRENTNEQLGDIAFTLQVGREELEHRLAWVVASRQELTARLQNHLADPRPPATIAVAKDELHELAAHWLKGGAVAWASLHEGRYPRRVRLPVYPFDKQPYWIGRDRPSAGARDIRSGLVALLSEALQLAPGAIDCGRHLYDFGIDSLLGMKLLRGLARRFGVEVQARDLVEHPTIEALAAHLGRKLPRQGSEVPAPAESTALSEGQTGLWALQQLAPEMSAYNIPLCFHIAQPVDVVALTAAVRRLLEEHPLLASRFVERGATLARETRPDAPIAFEHQDVAGLDADRLRAHIASITRKPFDLAADPLVRVHLLSRGPRDHRLLITLHHIVFDGGSFLPVCRGLFSAYRDIRDGKTAVAVFEDLYPQFVAWERQMLAGDEGARHRAYWTGQLAGPLPAMSLFTDFPRAASQPFAGQSQSVRLDPALSRRLRAFARQQRMTLSTLFLALFKVVLHRYSGQDDIVVGMAERGRSQERFESTVGYFINMLPIRTRDVGSKPFAGLLRELQLTMADAMDHAAYPFPRMVRDLGIVPDQGIAPVFQVAFEYQNAFSNGDLPAFNRELGDALGVTLMEEVGQEGEYELVLEVREGADDFLLNLKFNPTLFKPSTIAALAGHLTTVAEQAMAEPDRLSSELDLIPMRERKLLLEDWNRTDADYPKDQCVHQLFAQQALRTPQATAVACGGRQLSYAELDARSTSLAKYLQHRGVQPEQIVAVCIERSLEMVVALLAIAKAGAAWLPLDPRFPADRLRFMLGDSRASLVLTQSVLRPMLADVAAISLDTEWDAVEKRVASVDLRPEANASHLAYVIYTSGSTGTPKGVMVEHRALTNFLCSMAKRPGLAVGDRLLAVTTYSFDIAALELLLPLVRGGTCLICPADRAADVDLLRQEIRQLGPTMMQATPSTWTMLFASGWRNEERMKLLCGGEPLPPALKQQFVASGSEAWNMFGPTETTIWSTAAPIDDGDAGVSIGTPIANTQIHILDRYGRLAPLGVAGELCIGGDGLARGYLGNPALTAEKFIANPFEPGTRLYRTGDLARWREDGTLEHLGRLDHQVKIRGHRVELEEIETWLDRHASVGQSVVVARAQQGSQQLVAYYVAKARPATPAQLREHLARHLPDYMVPALYVPLAELPLTANGKTDRKALAAREPVVQRMETAPVSDSRVEQELLAMWRVLLDIGSIGVDDRFFELGGNSVTAVILARQIGDRFGIDIRAPDLFKYPTVREVARLVTRPATSRPAAPAPEAKERLWQGGGAPGYYRDSLAIVGISCHLPGARTLAQFWENLRQGKESSTPLSHDELRRAGVSDEVLNDPNFVPLQYSMEGKDLFDPAFFNISPKNAVFMDPQFRVLLQHAWQAIEDAGYAAQSIPDTAVFMSASNGFYKTLLHNSGTVDSADEYAAWIAGQGGTIPTMVSYQLGFKGPSLSVHSNCSSSLVALYLANLALQGGEARCALVGAASLFPIPGAGHFHQPGMNLSSDGHCRTFDAAADGLVGGEGVAVVMVKKALDAIEDGDHIYALVRGVAVNNDGSDKAGFYAPSVAGQAAAIDKVLTATGIDPESIGYVEAHGTGTRLGDPIEVMALDEVYRRYTHKTQFCRIGSVKPNIGHLDTAAGLAGLIKVALSLRHGEIPPSINYSTPNPDIDFASSAFSVVERLSTWPETGAPRRAAVSSFGIGGTNAHAVLEEYRVGANATTGGEQLIVLSARTEEQLKTYAGRLLEHVRGVDRARLDLGDMAFTLQTGRKPMAWRAAFQARTLAELSDRLERFIAGGAAEGCFRAHVRPAGEAAPVADRDDADHLVARWLAQSRLDKLAIAWVGGLEFDWSVLHRDGEARRISLPTYPFAEERYWVEAGTPVARAGTKLLLAHPVWKHRPVEAVPLPPYERRVRLEPKPSGATEAERYRSLCVQVFEALKPVVSELGVRTLLQVAHPGGEERGLYAGLAGLLKTARLENPGIVTQLIEIGAGDIAAALDESARCPDDVEVRYEGWQRLVPTWEASPDTTMPEAPWKEGGVYLLTGGAGALGLIFAEEIARQVSSATLVLVHRSDPAARQSARIDALRSKGVAVLTRKCDVSRRDEVDALVAEIVAAHGTISGILHCAGIVRDNWILKKTVAELEAVLAAKVDGAVNLDRATRGLDLDFFVSFSSAATVHGSGGQADYCAANAFLDEFTGHTGRAITIDWPLWRDGGMRPDAASEQAMREATGLAPLSTSSGIQAFYCSLASGRARTLVLEGDADAMRRWLAPGAMPKAEAAGPETLRAATTERLKRLVAQVIRMPAERIDPSEPLGTYGIDSIAIVRLNQQLEKILGRIPKTLFFQFQTVEALVGYLLQHHGDGCAAWTGQDAIAAPVVATPVARATAPAAMADDPIAIIGIAGRYPRADTLDAFWENLKAGRDCIGEIPSERWSMDGFFEADPKKAAATGRSYSRWGGFLDGFADFDPLFFNIAPKEALAIDPQERLFLQCAWHALEDAGYTRDSLQALNRRNVGVFVGVTKTGFELHGPELWRQGKMTFPHTSFSSVANRVSYCLNLRGPSMPIDTMCSASLTAIHEACQHIRHGDCEMAIAGGVNLYLHPSSYVGLCSVFMLSKDGQCRSFGDGGNGFVPGEGVGAVLLKRLSQAVRDGDRIHAVIRASSVNHGGKTNGYTVPNPTAQAELIADCLRKAGIDAGSVGYVEAHGTGTELGDPIEVAGLTEAFRHDTNDNGFCALGSVKSNIGHLEAAAGIAGLTKIVLQMRHGEIVPSLHARALNPNIDFAGTPFVVQQEPAPWRQGAGPRRAGLSSFGAGGANAHVVVEEYIAPEARQAPRDGAALLVLSARTGERLKQAAVDLLRFLQREAPPLHDVAYTLQIGREAFRDRLGLVASSLDELKQKLAQFIERGVVAVGDDKLLDRWVRGETVDWSVLYPGEKPRRVGLPGYPFARQRLWFDDQPQPVTTPADLLLLLRPVWDAVAVTGEALPAAGAKVAIIGGTPDQQQGIRRDFADAVVADESTIAILGELDHVVWLASSDVLSLFRLIKALLARGYGTREFGLTAITTQALAVHDRDPNDATHAAVHGLAGSLAREYPAWTVRALDVAAAAPWPAPDMWRVPALRGESHAWRGEWLRQKLVRVPSLPRSAEVYRDGGVYVVVGGAGALGEVWTRMMVRDHKARVVWLGRSPLGASIQAKLDGLGRLGPQPDYIQADARDAGAMADALRSIKAKHGAIHGLIVSTLGPYDQGLAQMSEELFRDILSSKRDVTLCVADCFRGEPLDFIAFFSSMAAFGRPAGMAAYASACVFADAFAHKLARERPGIVKVIDWGYWDAGGGVRISDALKNLVEHRGVQPIDATQGLDALEAALGAPFVQLAVTRTSKPDLVETYDGEEQVVSAPLSSRSCIDALVTWRPSDIVPGPSDAADELSEWIARLLHAQLRSVGQGARLAKYDRWWAESQNVLRYYGLDPGSAAPDTREVWAGWRARKPYFLAHSETRTLAVLVEDCLRELPGILSGRTLVTDILFPNGSMEKIEGLYKDNEVCDYFNSVVAGTVETYIERRVHDDPAARIRLIEIGAGTGGTTSTILPRLKRWQHHIAEYCYTDLSRSFFNHARQRYGDDYPYLDYRLCDIEQPLAAQGIAVGAYDIAIATNVLHATRSMRNTLRNAKAALGGNGVLILNEISDKTVFASVLFGLIDGWSLAEDEQWRIPGSPGLYPASWRSLLLQEGFTSVLFPAEPAHALGQQIVVAESDGVIRQRVSARAPEPQPVPVVEAVPAGTDVDVEGAILDALASSLSIDREAIELDVAFSDYGVDSILGVGFVQQVNKALALSLGTTVLFDHSTVARLTRHIGAEHRPVVASRREPVLAPVPLSTDGIAVIGMSGQFPGARNVEEFWRNMVGDVDPVVELPERYLERQAFSPQKQPGKSYCKWGGILETRDCFDPMFFNISPREAESMNPHQRLILLESWKALEDAGYNPKSLARSRTGIFVGCEPSAYVHETFTGASDAIVASRLSYFLDLTGPAFVVNTGCSSSGVALHLACEALRNNEADLALAGGAFAVMGQTILVGLSQTEMLSRGGRCRSFDADADGMVMSEGVGMVALKRLDQALADGDAIHGVIRASGTNQDGASNGITAPSGTAQQQLIADVYRRHGIDPERISYVEAHGTGTRLGDPVEANALVKAFRQFTRKTGYCAVGSSKSHIGHTSANAGVTGLISILLSLKHHRLPALRHFKKLNPLIEFDGSPFYPNTALSDWRSTDGRPLMAALNSFGHSGTNVHLVIEEFVGGGDARPAAANQPELIVVSAKDEERLPEVLGNLRAFVRETTASLFDVAYTLQTGREALEHRAAFVVRSLAELDRLLTSVLSGDTSRQDIWVGHVGPRRKPAAALTASGRPLGELAAAWVQGADVDWASLARAGKPQRLHLPTYPFAQERYWKPNDRAAPSVQAVLHPLVHRNVSTLSGLAFESSFTGAEFFFADHLVGGEKVLPGVACLEMARAALAHARGHGSQLKPVRFENIVWTAPLSPSDVMVAFEAPQAGAIPYRISSAAGLHHQGLVREAPPVAPSASVVTMIGRTVAAEACYAALADAGVQHGQVFKALRTIQVGNGQVLAKLEVAEPDEAYGLHPALMDAALQATIALALDAPGDRPVLLPFALDALDVMGPCEPVMWAWIRPGNGPQKLDIDLCTEAGEVRVRLSGLASRALSPRRSGSDVAHFDGSEFFLQDHGGMLPAAVYLELARATVARQGGGTISALTNIVWPTPMMVGSEGGDLATSLKPDGAFAMVSGSIVHCQGRAVFDEAVAFSDARGIHAIQSRCGTVLDKAACDALLRSTHGPSLLSIEHLRYNADEALALLELPVDQGVFHLHPSLLNGAILASVVWTLTGRPGADLPLPFSLEALRIAGKLPSRLYAHVRRHSSAVAREVVDIDLLDLDGLCVASFERFTTLFKETSEGTIFATPGWVDRPLAGKPATVAVPTIVLAERDDELQKVLWAEWPDASIEVLHGPDAAGSFLHLFERCQRAAAAPLLVLIPDGPQAALHNGLVGLLRTLRLEQPRTAAKAIRNARLVSQIAAEMAPSDDVEIRYDSDGRRQVRTLSEIALPDAASAFQPGDVVWITGGLGGIGRVVARHLGLVRKARLVLSGRSNLSADGQRFIDGLRQDGVEVTYLQVDVGEALSVKAAVAEIERHFGGLQGIVHGAGTIEDDYIANKTVDQLERVLRPKMAGTLALDDATRHLKLKYFILCSSIAGVQGNLGQADYAGANAFLDGFAQWRNENVGRTISIDWPLWRDGGMRMGAANEELMRQATGMVAMDAESGMRALERCLASGHAQVLVAYGDTARIRERLLSSSEPSLRVAPDGLHDDLRRRLASSVRAELVRLVAEVQRIRPEKVSLQRDLSDYGFDSISFTELANALNRTYALTLMPTLFFEIPDLEALADHLIAHHPQALLKKYSLAMPTIVAAPTKKMAPIVVAPTAVDSDAIAVIGMAGKFPGTADPDELWRQLEANRDLIGEVPAARWDWREIYGDPHAEPGKTRVKWGGFVADADCFDAGFFGIAPAEAEAMDPQLRLFLETVWSALEDAGYQPSALSGSRTGVFAGVATADYKELLAEARRNGAVTSPAEPFPFMVANRVSYQFNFHGPSEVVDTACSSSLIAVHRAIESMRHGNCDVALAGGVNVMASPRITVASSQAGMLSEDGRCMTFDQRANGYVRSEGVAVLMLKPLGKAVADGDRILGVIRASGENHGGRAASPTAPNAAAQKQLLVDVYSRAGIDPATIGYIEAHGTGTSLGDPVEVNGLKAAFAELYRRRGLEVGQAHCALGSVKANIGHLEAAAGAAGLIKVLLMLRHRRIPGNPQLMTPNPYLQLDGTPFHLVTETRDWAEGATPRRAGVSSFGVGGSNAHVVVEEYRSPASTPAKSSPVLIVLSAKDEQRLRDQANRLARFIADNRQTISLADLAYTLQVGREPMPCRLAFLAASLEEVEHGLLHAEVTRHDDGLREISADEDMASTFDAWIAKGKHDKLLDAWLKGFRFDWTRLYGDVKPARIGLPTYPFARERHWVPAGERVMAPKVPSDLGVLQETWSEETLGRGSGQAIETLLCITADREHRQAIMRWAAEGGDRPRVIFEQAAGGVRADAVLYLAPLADPAAVADAYRIVDLLKQKPRRLILSGLHANEVERCHLDSWVAFGRSLGLVLPDTEVAVVFRDGASFAIDDWMRTLWAELLAPRLHSAWYRGGTRHVTRTQEIDLPADVGERPLRQGGAYLITGGCGGLGMVFAEHLARTYAAKLLLTGRSPPDDRIEAKLRRLRELGGEALYVPADVADETAMREAVRQAQAWGRLDGVLHVAGISGAAGVLEAKASGFKQVLAAKVEGTLVLERVLDGLDPDFVCYFSSSSAILGDFGSCDYAVANRFQTAYARAGRRRIAINWPLWQDGGRGVGDAEQTRLYLESSGQRALTSVEGIRLFERLLSAGGSQYLVQAGPAPRPMPTAGDASLDECVSRDLKQEIHRLLKTRPEEILPRRNFVDFGFDSISLAEFSRVLGRLYALEISPSVFFSHSTLQRLTSYFVAEHRATMEAFYARRDMPAAPLAKPPVPAPAVVVSDPDEPIAIVGMSGRFPKARNVDELWQLLAEGVDAVEEIPPDRFDWRRYADKTSSRWGGFIPGIAEFDPLFFEISPLEAERMDPRQRHLLQEAWLALEDAGYGAAEIARQRIGMFVGVEEGSDYQRRQAEVSLTSTHNGVLASRLAYFLDLKGPVMAINTACSSGLVAAHTACQSLRQGECDTAIAAGVNLMVAPEAYVGMTQAGMLSPDGKCYVFDKRANGMVPGEAVAVVVLKRLSRALADGDPIHAVIRGSGINYDGRTNGITAPSGASQTELLRDVHARSRLGPQDIDYIVTHGTGTRLGDPVEINALYDAFKPGNDRQGYCALTSTKSNLGHTFAASGLVSLIGLVQAMKHRTIPASLHCEQESDYIRWKESPFYVNKRAKPWVTEAGRPRVGAVSAFGISGTNAHMVVQEHVPEPVRKEATPGAASLLVLSGKNASALQERIAQTIAFLQSSRAAALDLAGVSHTLLHGRHHFEHRSAVVARSLDEAVEAWRGSRDRRGVVGRTFTGEATVRREIEALARRAPDAEALEALAGHYCQGYDIPSHGIAPRRIGLPGYPFSRKRYWLEERAEIPLAQTISGFSYPEMARVAAERALGQGVTALGNMVWGPAAPSSSALSVRLHRADRDIAYSVGLENREGTCFHLGEVVAGTASVEPSQPQGKAEVSTLHVTDTERAAGMLFAPSLIEAAWRVVGGAVLPFALRRIETFAPLPEQVTLHLVRKEGAAPGQRTVDMTFLDAEGKVCLRLLDFTGAPREQLIDLSSSG